MKIKHKPFRAYLQEALALDKLMAGKTNFKLHFYNLKTKDLLGNPIYQRDFYINPDKVAGEANVEKHTFNKKHFRFSAKPIGENSKSWYFDCSYYTSSSGGSSVGRETFATTDQESIIDTLKILIHIIDCVKELLKTYPETESLTFSASVNEKSKIKLFDFLSNQITKKLGYKVETDASGNHKKYTIKI